MEVIVSQERGTALGRYAVQHVRRDDRDHGKNRHRFCDSKDLYTSYRRGGQGRVDLILAADVRNFLDDVVYSNKLPWKDLPRVFISLSKMLQIGCTMETERWNNWILRKNGNLVIFGASSRSSDARTRTVLGPRIGEGPNAEAQLPAVTVAGSAENRLPEHHHLPT